MIATARITVQESPSGVSAEAWCHQCDWGVAGTPKAAQRWAKQHAQEKHGGQGAFSDDSL